MGIGEIHTVANYFTVALVVLGIIFETLGRSKQNDGAMRYGWNSLRLGLLFALISVGTGFAAASSDKIFSDAETSAMFHKTIGIVFAVSLAIIVLFRTAFAKKIASTDSGAALRGAYAMLEIVGVVLLVVTLFLGTRLVRTYGVGVAPVEKMNSLPATPPPAPANGIVVDTTHFRQ